MSFESLEDRTVLGGGSHRLPPAIVMERPSAAGSVSDVPSPGHFSAFPLDNATSPQLVITQPPDDTALVAFVDAGTPFSVTAALEDGQGNILSDFDGSMTIAIASNPGGATLGGTLTAAARDGVAVFPGLTLDQPGEGYVLQVSGAGLQTTTAPFDVEPNKFITLRVLPPGPTVLSIQGVKKGRALDKIILTFSSPMDPATVADRHNYTLLDAGRDRRLHGRGRA